MSLPTGTPPKQGLPPKMWLRVSLTVVVGVVLLIACIQTSPSTKMGGETEHMTHGLYAAPELGVVVDENMKVVDVDLGSVAEKAGIQKGDVLVSLDGVSFVNDKNRIDALIQESPGEEAYAELEKTGVWNGIARTLKLERDGKESEVEVTPAPLTWWGLSPTPTEVSPELNLDYL